MNTEMTEEEKLNEMSGTLATETFEETSEDETSAGSGDFIEVPLPAPTRALTEESEKSEDTEKSENTEGSEESEKLEPRERTDAPGCVPTKQSAAEARLEEMTKRIGAEGLLEIIKGNRNRIIDQLIAEAKAEQRKRPMPSGVSAAKKATTIFDIAAFA